VAEGGALLRRYGAISSIEGSNPSFSAQLRQRRCKPYVNATATASALSGLDLAPRVPDDGSELRFRARVVRSRTLSDHQPEPSAPLTA
jgi:hypothetical protein